jgi:glutathione S-transferase
VPVYQEDGLTIWDSLAIAEYLAEQYPPLWPEDKARRAKARSIAAEMHSGFFALREAMPMNCRAQGRKVQQTPALKQDIQRILAIWNECREQNAAHGPWLFGTFSIADAMYAPVVTRFHTYGVETDSVAAAYMQTLLAGAAVKRWYEAARQETEVIESEEVG